MSFLGQSMRAALDLLSPPVCAACQTGLEATRPGQPFCATCELAVAPRDPHGCAACDHEVVGAGGLCRRCRARLSPLQGVRATFDYDGPIADAIQRLKYELRDDLAKPLADRWLKELGPTDLIPQGAGQPLVCPVPLHPDRLAHRGFDQAWLLARALARALALPAAARAVRRRRATRPQVGLGLAARERNVHGAFQASTQVTGRHVILVDDVLTTGASLRACAQAAREAGALSITAFTLARAPA